MVHWHFYISILLDEYNAIVKMTFTQSNAERTIVVNVLPLKIGTSTKDV